MIIGIMGAMPEEISSIRRHMSGISEIEHGSRIYYSGKINGIDVVLVFSRWGKVAAAATVTSLITEFKINQIIFTGVAGATSKELNIGDIIISDKLYQHDMDPRPFFPKHEIPLTGITLFHADKTLVRAATLACQELLSTIGETVGAEKLGKFNITSPKYRIGVIASGDKFVHEEKETETILAEKPETTAVEMEGAAVAQVCHDYSIPFVIIRTISDRADHEAHIDFPKFVEEIASHYSENIIRHMLSM